MFAVIVMTLLFMRVLGGIRFTDGMTDGLLRAAALFGVYGDEGIEDFYLLTTALASLALSLLIVGTANVVRTRRARP